VQGSLPSFHKRGKNWKKLDEAKLKGIKNEICHKTEIRKQKNTEQIPCHFEESRLLECYAVWLL
jgi:Zn-finger protein